MTRSEIIKQAQNITENKLVGQVDFNLIFNQVIQDFCSSHRYWWRKKRLSFTTTADATYDLTTITTMPDKIGPYVDEITKVLRVDSVNQIAEIEPVFDDEAVAAMVVNTTTTDKPAIYTIDSDDLTNFQKIRLSPRPNGAFTIYVFFWAMPNPSSDSSDDTVPIVPATKHHILTTGLEKEIWRMVFGQQDPKYVTAKKFYDDKLAQEKLRTAFSTKKSMLFSGVNEDAIRSTR